jgi:hypothetical protein
MKSQTTTISRSSFLRLCALGLPLLPASVLKAQDASRAAGSAKLDPGNLRAFVELARSDIRTGKAIIIAENIDFTEAEAVEFWPVHREYELELNKLLDRRLELITRFADQYRTMTDADATKLADDVFDLEAKRTGLKRKYFKKFSKVVPALKTARFFQIENQLNMVLDLQIAASLPLIK